MRFRTEIEIAQFNEKIKPGDRVFSIGSCFAENIAGRLRDGGFAITSNPFGVLYNPASIAMALEHISSDRKCTQDDLVLNGELWCSPFFHGSFSDINPEEALGKMNRAAEESRRALAEADHVIISFGTPWVYTVSERFGAGSFPRGMVVANCHKFPADHYCRRRMTVEEITETYIRLHAGILKGKNVIYTVSPVRYIKDGLHGSNLGKAVLQLAVENICAASDSADYFPAYEALIDDLRDYRFYDYDMIHPSAEAVEYIWELFRCHAMTAEAARQAEEVEKITAAVRHRVQNPGSGEHLRWLESMIEKTAKIRTKFPAAELSRQEAFFSDQLSRWNNERR